MRSLSFADVERAIAGAPELGKVVLVGGQALNFWAGYFGIITAETESLYGAALSKDIDFLGSPASARQFARATGGEARIAGFGDIHTPNTGLVTIDFDGQSHTVDFLGSLMGFDHGEVQRVYDLAVKVRTKDGAGPGLAVMHPVHCLQSQLANVYGIKLDRRSGPAGERNVQRVRLAVEVCRRTVQERIDAGHVRDAFPIVEKAHRLSLTEESMRARHQDGLRVEHAIPVERLPGDFQMKRWPQLVREHEIAEHKYRRLLERRAVIAAKKKRSS